MTLTSYRHCEPSKPGNVTFTACDGDRTLLPRMSSPHVSESEDPAYTWVMMNDVLLVTVKSRGSANVGTANMANNSAATGRAARKRLKRRMREESPEWLAQVVRGHTIASEGDIRAPRTAL